MEENAESPYDETCNKGFYNFEIVKFKRLLNIINEEQLDTSQLSRVRSDFVKFVDEHDKRRHTNFLQTFPEMETEYHEWKHG
jgi:hypothetical protein